MTKNQDKASARINHQIKASEVRVVDESGEMLGILSPEEGLKIAKGRGLDLVEISPKAKPPVCKVMDYGKYKYEQQKKAHEARKKQKTIEVKEIKLRPNIAEGDLGVKLRNLTKFIKEGNKVKVSLMFRGREVVHNDIGYALLSRIKEETAELAKVETEAKMEGRQIFMILAPQTS